MCRSWLPGRQERTGKGAGTWGIEDAPVICCHSNAACEPQPSEVCRGRRGQPQLPRRLAGVLPSARLLEHRVPSECRCRGWMIRARPCAVAPTLQQAGLGMTLWQSQRCQQEGPHLVQGAVSHPLTPHWPQPVTWRSPECEQGHRCLPSAAQGAQGAERGVGKRQVRWQRSQGTRVGRMNGRAQGGRRR